MWTVPSGSDDGSSGIDGAAAVFIAEQKRDVGGSGPLSFHRPLRALFITADGRPPAWRVCRCSLHRWCTTSVGSVVVSNDTQEPSRKKRRYR